MSNENKAIDDLLEKINKNLNSNNTKSDSNSDSSNIEDNNIDLSSNNIVNNDVDLSLSINDNNIDLSSNDDNKIENNFTDLASTEYKKNFDEDQLYKIQGIQQDEEKPLEEGISLSEISEKSLNKKVKKKKKSKGCFSTAAWITAIIVLSVTFSAVIIMTFIDMSGITFGNDKECEVVIPQYSSTAEIANILKEADVINYPFIFRIYSRLTGADGTYQYGRYFVKNSSGYEGIVAKLQTIGSFAKQVSITIPEGSSITEIIALLEKNDVCTTAEFKEAMNKTTFDYKFIDSIPTQSVYYLLEGYLYPETYYFNVKDGDNGVENAKRSINTMLTQLDDVLTDEMYAKADKMGYTINEVMTMASIIELEASGSPNEMNKVAQVFYNRLNWDQPKFLGSTPTSKYPSSRYNTNTNEGLPPGPLCSPSYKAIMAALEPDKTVKATYFVTDKNMKFYYTNSLSEHNALVKSLKNRGLWEY